MPENVTLINCPSGARGDAFLTINSRRGRIVFSKAAAARMGLVKGKRIVFTLTGDELSVSVTDECNGFPLRAVKKNASWVTLGIFSSSAARLIISRCCVISRVVRIRIGAESEDGWFLITNDAKEVL